MARCKTLTFFLRLAVALILLSIIVAILYPAMEHFYTAGISGHMNMETPEKAKDYYAFIASLSGIFVSFCGLFLGFYYFTKKNEIEDKAKKEKQTSSVARLVLDEARIVDGHLKGVFLYKKSDLLAGVSLAYQNYEAIYRIIKANPTCFSDDDKKALLGMYSMMSAIRDHASIFDELDRPSDTWLAYEAQYLLCLECLYAKVSS